MNAGDVTMVSEGNGVAQALPGTLTQDDVELLRGLAAMFTDIVGPFGVACARHVHDQIPELPQDDETVESSRAAAEGNPREMLSMLRAGLPSTAQETPVEALAHTRFLQGRGVGLTTIVAIYQYGFTMFRDILATELADRVPDRAQAARIAQAVDEYFFPYIGKVTLRIAAEYGLTEGGWFPRPDDPVLNNPASAEAARQLREEQLAKGAWLPASPEQSHARQDAEQALDAFVATLEEGSSLKSIAGRLKLADTTIAITLADEPDLSVTLLLDRAPIEIVDGVSDAESHMWIASVDLNRIWLPDFYLPMAITKGRVRIDGQVRKFLRIVPILRELAGNHRDIVASLRREEIV